MKLAYIKNITLTEGCIGVSEDGNWNFKKSYQITLDEEIYEDWKMCKMCNMSEEDYQNKMVNEFNGKLVHCLVDEIYVFNNERKVYHTHFISKEDAKNAIEWLESLMLMDKLRGEK